MPEPLALLSESELGDISRIAGPSGLAIKRGPVADRVRAVLNGIDHLFRAILVIALVVQLLIVLTGIVSRFWFDDSILWADEAAKLFLSMTAFIGGALAFRARHHTTVEFLTGKLPPRWRISFAVGVDLLILVAAVVVGYVSLDLVSDLGNVGYADPADQCGLAGGAADNWTRAHHLVCDRAAGIYLCVSGCHPSR